LTEPEIPPEPREEVPVWAPFAALLAVLMIVSITAAAAYGVISATDPSIKDTDDLPDAATLALTFFQDLVFVFGAWIAIRLALGRTPREQFGLRRVSSLVTAFKWAAAAYASFWLVAVVLAIIFGDPEDQALVTDLKDEDALGVLIAWAILICVLAPAVEEVFFRGFMFTVFAKRMGVVWAALLDGVVFGLGHAPAAPVQLAALGAFGVGLCLLYWRTQSIIPGMALHALNNSITFGVTKDLDAGLFAAVVVLSVGTVIAGATAVSARAKVAA
jgi:membrane protease YdiL (CAAX protease family)